MRGRIVGIIKEVSHFKEGDWVINKKMKRIDNDLPFWKASSRYALDYAGRMQVYRAVFGKFPIKGQALRTRIYFKKKQNKK